jgi:hypothetical protein
MKMVFRFVLLAAIVTAGVWLWTVFFPAPEKIIRRNLSEIARDASFEGNQNPLAGMAAVQKLAAFFSTNVIVNLDMPGREPRTFAGRDEIVQAAAAARGSLNGLKIEFLDVNVTVAPDKQSAVTDLTARAQAAGDRDFNVQEMKFTFQKTGGQWLITRVETVRTLS